MIDKELLEDSIEKEKGRGDKDVHKSISTDIEREDISKNEERSIENCDVQSFTN